MHDLPAIADYVMPQVAEGRADLGFLFGTRHGIEEFCSTAYALWQRGMFPKLLVSGGATAGLARTEAEVIAERLLGLGMPEGALILESAATNTGENVILSRRLAEAVLGQDSVKSLLVIGKVCSMRRYLMTLERHWPQPRRFACAVNYFGVERERWHEHEEFRQRVMAEFTKIPQYLKQGFLREVDLDGI
jgi:uncharacterized SAM-binding protein YcdF (DUF218 family)